MAAGGSTRLGRPKQLLPFARDVLINHMIRTIKNGGVDKLIIVLGSSYMQVKEKIKDKQSILVLNQDWEIGLSSSIRQGLVELTADQEAVIFFVVDQPFLNSDLISKFIAHYLEFTPGILATRVGKQICHPVLFTRQYFNDLKTLIGDKGGSQLFNNQPVDFFDWEDPKILSDIDIEHDFNELKKLTS